MKAREEYMAKWKTVRVKQELLTAVERTLETGRYKSLSEFVSEAVRLRLDELRQSHEKLSEMPLKYPVIYERLLCSQNHMWAMVTPEGNIRIGLSDYAQERLKGIVSIQTESIGTDVAKDKPFGVIETWMFMFDLHATVSGKIVKLNKLVQDKPLIINEDPYETGWIAEIKPDSVVALEEELRGLMGPNQYKIWVTKLRHFARAKPQPSN
jgi:glycine cleavage system H protein